MSKLYGYYKDDVDYTWYDSSTVKYSECVDHPNALKTLRVAFNNGTCYEYADVDVMDYLMFRDDLSQGKALNKYIKSKGYEYKKLDNIDMDELDRIYHHMADADFYISLVDADDDNKKEIKVERNSGEVLYQGHLVGKEEFETLVEILEAIGIRFKIEKGWE